MNASIEAAKAGEYGSGFAVVAQEVKDLAQQSKDATLQITDTLTAIEHVRSAGYNVTVEPKTLNLGAMEVTIAFFDGPQGESI